MGAPHNDLQEAGIHEDNILNYIIVGIIVGIIYFPWLTELDVVVFI